VLLLLGSAVTAFGVAPLAPDAAKLPRRVIADNSAAPVSLSGQLAALEANTIELHRSDLTRSSDTADTLMQRLGLDDPEAAAFLRRDAVARRLLEGRPGKMVQALAAHGRLIRLTARYPAADFQRAATHFTRLRIDFASEPPTASIEELPLRTEVRLGSGTIDSSLFAAADDARLPDTVTMQLAEIFGSDIDFRRDLRRGDTFSVLYETRTADGEPVAWNQSAGRVLSAQFVNAGKAYDALWFEQRSIDGQRPLGGYFGLDGRSKTRMFLASPLAYSRMTSGFAMRMHPILKTWRAHMGVDYAAPSGTAVRAVGEGVVEFAGWQSGYGNVAILRHAGDRETRYAHLSRLDVKRGQAVQQGQSIGAVGATGWATGPHLHFEFRVRGDVMDPLTIARSSEALAIRPTSTGRFVEAAATARAQLGAAAPSTSTERFE
jgi:murein DD-endopeptidase MepM/ murein hydrolase activator NlpD